ncbi:MAG: hypothetical protein P9M15_02120 [Candidatus Electryoneaceae bacterium]|nr:hypothetical protein [Candidatus Electryoneaceae bacterium]
MTRSTIILLFIAVLLFPPVTNSIADQLNPILYKTIQNPDNVNCVAFNTDGSIVASGCGDQVIMWVVSTGNEIRTLSGHSHKVTSIAFSPDGSVFASASGVWNSSQEEYTGGEIILWNVISGRRIRTLTGHSKQVNSVAFNHDGTLLASGSYDKTIILWNPNNGQQLKSLTGHSRCVRSVCFSPDGAQLVSCADDKTIKLWNVQTGGIVRTMTGHTDWVRSVAFSPTGEFIASGSDDKKIKLWNAYDGSEVRTMTGHTDWIRSVAFSHDGNIIASGEDDEIVKLWDVRSGNEIKTLKGHSSFVMSVAFSQNGMFLASGSLDHTVKLWQMDVSNGESSISVGGASPIPVGSRVRSLRTSDVLRQGDKGIYFGMHEPPLSPPAFVIWDRQLGTGVTRPDGCPEQAGYEFNVKFEEIEVLRSVAGGVPANRLSITIGSRVRMIRNFRDLQVGDLGVYYGDDGADDIPAYVLWDRYLQSEDNSVLDGAPRRDGYGFWVNFGDMEVVTENGNSGIGERFAIGSRVRMIRDYDDKLVQGDVGTYYGTDNSDLPAYVIWDRYLGTEGNSVLPGAPDGNGHAYWVKFEDIEIVR